VANEGDYGNQAAELFRRAALENARKQESVRLTGFCQNDCGEPTRGAFCSAECRADYNARQRMKHG